MVLSRSTNAPPHMKRMFFVLICILKNVWNTINKINKYTRIKYEWHNTRLLKGAWIIILSRNTPSGPNYKAILPNLERLRPLC